MSYLCKWYQWERKICWRSFKTKLGVQWKFSDELLVSFLWNKSVVSCALLTCTLAEDVLVSALRERKLEFHRLWRHMFKRNLCSVNIHVMCECSTELCVPSGGLSLPLHHVSPPMSARVLALYGMAAASRPAIGYRGQIVLLVGRFPVH